MALKPQYICLDIGTTKVTMLAAAFDDKAVESGGVTVVAHASSPCRGLSRGMVVDIDATVASICEVVKTLKQSTKSMCRDVLVSLSGHHVQAMRSHGIVAVGQGEIHQSDVDRVIEAAKAVAVPANRTILHVLPQEYVVDDQSGVENPIGMVGVRLEVKVLIVTCSNSALQNIVRCVERSGLRVQQIVLAQLASSAAVLSSDEKNLGVCVLDMGGGTTDIAIYTKGVIQHASVVAIAGDHVTNDIAMALRTPPNCAERLKLEHGIASASCLQREQMIEVPGLTAAAPRSISSAELLEVVGARYHEIFSFVAQELTRQGFHDSIPGGVVLTGGAAKVMGVKTIATQVLGHSVRVAQPVLEGMASGLHDPACATVVGMLLHGSQSRASMSRWRAGRLTKMWRSMQLWLEQHL